jgi:DNA end-binding protein Ku
MLEPRGKGLLATALRYNTEVRDEESYFDDIPNVKIPPDMVKLATHILESKQGHFDPSQFEDRYEKALSNVIKAKRAGKAPPEPAAPRPSNVINLMDALRRSVQGEEGAQTSRRRRAPRSSARRRPAPRRGRVKRAS